MGWGARGAGAGALKAGLEPAGAGALGPDQGAASRHARADVPSTAPGAGPHLQTRDAGLESAEHAAWTCPAGRHHGATGGSPGKLSVPGGVRGRRDTHRIPERGVALEDLGGAGGQEGLTRGQLRVGEPRT